MPNIQLCLYIYILLSEDRNNAEEFKARKKKPEGNVTAMCVSDMEDF